MAEPTTRTGDPADGDAPAQAHDDTEGVPTDRGTGLRARVSHAMKRSLFKSASMLWTELGMTTISSGGAVSNEWCAPIWMPSADTNSRAT